MGLRGKMAVLSEGYSNADFRTRVRATYDFVHEVLSDVAEHRAVVLAAVEALAVPVATAQQQHGPAWVRQLHGVGPAVVKVLKVYGSLT
jgi:hypothetical protein